MNEFLRKFYHSEVGTVFLLSIFSLLEALQLLITVIFLAGFIKVDPSALAGLFTSNFEQGVHVEREVTFFRI